MEPKTIVAIVLVALSSAALSSCRLDRKTRSELIIQGAEQKLRPFSISQGGTQ